MSKYDRILNEEVPKSLLSKSQFDIVTDMCRLDAVKYIASETKCGLKIASIYYDLYLRDYE